VSCVNEVLQYKGEIGAGGVFAPMPAASVALHKLLERDVIWHGPSIHDPDAYGLIRSLAGGADVVGVGTQPYFDPKSTFVAISTCSDLSTSEGALARRVRSGISLAKTRGASLVHSLLSTQYFQIASSDWSTARIGGTISAPDPARRSTISAATGQFMSCSHSSNSGKIGLSAGKPVCCARAMAARSNLSWGMQVPRSIAAMVLMQAVGSNGFLCRHPIWNQQRPAHDRGGFRHTRRPLALTPDEEREGHRWIPACRIARMQKAAPCGTAFLIGAGEGIRTLDPNLGKVMLYP